MQEEKCKPLHFFPCFKQTSQHFEEKQLYIYIFVLQLNILKCKIKDYAFNMSFLLCDNTIKFWIKFTTSL